MFRGVNYLFCGAGPVVSRGIVELYVLYVSPSLVMLIAVEGELHRLGFFELFDKPGCI
jgi:hypothetical protein